MTENGLQFIDANPIFNVEKIYRHKVKPVSFTQFSGKIQKTIRRWSIFKKFGTAGLIIDFEFLISEIGLSDLYTPPFIWVFDILLKKNDPLLNILIPFTVLFQLFK